MSRARLAALGIVGVAIVFALFAGEYGTFDWFRLRADEREERARIRELERIVDSLQDVASGLEKDPRVQERVAREEFGMIRKGEHVYRLLPADSTTDR
ncbi:MAG: septum formation initiator family protein [Gemmatimonadales bacterium]|nr:septum formation initiator family protein [Gemmatimonadales bacterium]